MEPLWEVVHLLSDVLVAESALAVKCACFLATVSMFCLVFACAQNVSVAAFALVRAAFAAGVGLLVG